MPDIPDPWLLRGTLTTFTRRCGKPSCRCAAGEPHASPALRYTVEGKTRTVTLGQHEVAEVAGALERYQTAVQELDDAADAGIDALRARRGARRQVRG